jgi:hypothetical protein
VLISCRLLRGSFRTAGIPWNGTQLEELGYHAGIYDSPTRPWVDNRGGDVVEITDASSRESRVVSKHNSCDPGMARFARNTLDLSPSHQAAGLLCCFTITISNASALMSPAQLLHYRADKLLGVAEEHQRVIEIVERVVDACEARVHAALDDHYSVSLIDIENGHTEDWA